MKKLFYLLLLSWFASCGLKPALAQTPKFGRIFTSTCGVPATRPTALDSTKDYLLDSCSTYAMYNFYKWKTGRWNLAFAVSKSSVRSITSVIINGNGQLIISYSDGTSDNLGVVVGKDGVNGTDATVTVGSTTTGAPGTNAIVTNSGTTHNAILNFSIPAGRDGTGGGGSTPKWAVSPDDYGACHCNTGSTDADAIQTAFNNSSGKVVELYGTYFLSHGIKKPKYSSLLVHGNNAQWITTNNNPFDALGSDQPTSLSDALSMENYTVVVEDLNIQVQSVQTGMNFRASKNNRYMNVNITGGVWGFRSEFQLIAYYQGCYSIGAANGFFIGCGTFPGADQDNSQSNYTYLLQCRTHTNSTVGFGIYNTYGVRLTNCINEGNGTIAKCVDYDAGGSNTTKDFYADTHHFEQVGGCTDAIFKIRTRDGTIQITDPIAHYSGILIDATGTTGQGVIILNNCSYAVGKSGKYFRGSNIAWSFSNCSLVPFRSFVSGSFEGAAPQFCPQTVTNNVVNSIQGCGYYHYSINEIPR